MSELPPRRPWFRFQFSLATVLWLMLVVGMGVAWWNDRREFDQRLRKLEGTYAPTVEPMWSAADILGAPDDPTGMGGKSWCPLASQGKDWVEVGFDWGVPAATIDVYETYSVGCVTELLVVDGSGNETSIWKGTDPTPPAMRTGLFQVPVPKSIKAVQRVKICQDSTAGGASWPCIDAVGLTTSSGKTTWATSSQCSSVYGRGSLTAATNKTLWQKFW
jgi:hypothetical protein